MKKKKFFSIFLLITALAVTSITSASTNLKIKVNGEYIYSDVAPFINNSCTYVPIRFVSNALGIKNVSWDASTNSVSIINNQKTLLLYVNRNYAYINNTYTQLDNPVLLVNSRTFVPIRFISECFDAEVDWDQENSTVLISTEKQSQTTATSRGGSRASSTVNTSSSTPVVTSSGTKNTESVSNSSSTSVYNYDNAVYWLSRIIEAEAVGEPFKGKVAVGEVILNRVESSEFPNTIWGVIFDSKFGIQFEPVANGTIWNTPSQESIEAAKVALNGSNYVGNCLYFFNPTIAKSSWISKNREYFTTISKHQFYL